MYIMITAFAQKSYKGKSAMKVHKSYKFNLANSFLDSRSSLRTFIVTKGTKIVKC